MGRENDLKVINHQKPGRKYRIHYYPMISVQMFCSYEIEWFYRRRFGALVHSIEASRLVKDICIGKFKLSTELKVGELHPY